MKNTKCFSCSFFPSFTFFFKVIGTAEDRWGTSSLPRWSACQARRLSVYYGCVWTETQIHVIMWAWFLYLTKLGHHCLVLWLLTSAGGEDREKSKESKALYKISRHGQSLYPYLGALNPVLGFLPYMQPMAFQSEWFFWKCKRSSINTYTFLIFRGVNVTNGNVVYY